MTTQNSKHIKPINKEAVHRICSGQVVLNLAVAIKELVENSLDAGATVIEVRLREFGSEFIEVTDNGNGVEPVNFQGLTLKHHTSKLQDFSDLVTVETFGFRGEALSSLCSLSNLSVTTRHVSSDFGSRLVFDHNGQIISCSSVARQVGTTVSLENIFSTLPVRQKEFHRNLKREFNKMTQLLYAYCLVSTGVKIICTNHTKKGGRMTVVSTQGCKTVRENITCVFGTKQLSSLLEMQTVMPSSELLEQMNMKDMELQFELEGFVSSCAHGQGRSTNDRQFYYVNSRPCEPTKVMKAVNEVYHQYNMHQQPFVFLNVHSSRISVDVNVTPDKRQVFLEHEQLLVATVKASLQALYENIPSTYSMNCVSSTVTNSLPSPTTSSQSSPANILSQLCRQAANKRSNLDEPVGKLPKQAKLDSIFKRKEQTSVLLNRFTKGSSSSLIKEDNSKSVVDSEAHKVSCNGPTNGIQERLFGSENDSVTENLNPDLNVGNCDILVEKNYECSSISNEGNAKREVFVNNNPNTEVNCQINSEESETPVTTSQSSIYDDHSTFQPSNVTDSSLSSIETNYPSTQFVSINEISSPPKSSSLLSIHLSPSIDCKKEKSDIDLSQCVKYDVGFTNENLNRHSVEVRVSMADLRDHVRRSHEKANSMEEARVRFRAVIDPSKNKQAEQELSREISKDMFCKMDVVGQFNLGFIVARLNSDLFIVDQHATDEKYNFETLQRTTTISNQKLVVPQQLELTAVNEAILMDNISVFKTNGFEFLIDENAPPTTKVKLTSIPISRNWTFGKEDIDELLFMLQDSPNTLCRPSRVRAMFASRACRKSVMIGSALSRSEMKRLLTHMGEIEQPWNCPHGRPTMRHLINVDFI